VLTGFKRDKPMKNRKNESLNESLWLSSYENSIVRKECEEKNETLRIEVKRLEDQKEQDKEGN
jgi:hypothetical protein